MEGARDCTLNRSFAYQAVGQPQRPPALPACQPSFLEEHCLAVGVEPWHPAPVLSGTSGLDVEDAPNASKPEEVKNSWGLKPKLGNSATVPGNAYSEPGLRAGGHGFNPHLHFPPTPLQIHMQ